MLRKQTSSTNLLRRNDLHDAARKPTELHNTNSTETAGKVPFCCRTEPEIRAKTREGGWWFGWIGGGGGVVMMRVICACLHRRFISTFLVNSRLSPSPYNDGFCRVINPLLGDPSRCPLCLNGSHSLFTAGLMFCCPLPHSLQKSTPLSPKNITTPNTHSQNNRLSAT